MFTEQMRQAVTAAPRERLQDLSSGLWKAWAAGAVTDDQASELAALIKLRQTTPVPTPRRSGSRPRSDAHLARRRQWAASGWLPPVVASGFTPGEIAALSIVACEVALHGRCELSVGAIAGKAGVGDSTVRNGLRQARALGLMTIEERRLSYARSLSNVVRITSSEWTAWIAFRGRGLAKGGRVQNRAALESTCLYNAQKLERNLGKGNREVRAPHAQRQRDARRW